MRICKVVGCERKHFARGYCHTHYVRYMRIGYAGNENIRIHQKAIPCKICGGPHKARGYCKIHYQQMLGKGIFRENGICKVDNCNRGIYAKGYCRKHHETNKRTGNPLGLRKICVECGKTYIKENKPNLCSRCYPKYIASLNPKRYKGDGGDRWGYKEYRIIKKLKKTYCEKCKATDKKLELHHKDKNKRNSNPNNLITVCHKCHHKHFHTGEKKQSKYTKKYGIPQYEIAKKLNEPIAVISRWHKTGHLKRRLNNEKVA